MGARDGMPAGTLRRAEGINSIRSGTLRSRFGLVLLYAMPGTHSLYRFRDVRFQGTGGVLYRDGVALQGGFDGERLTFARMPPTAGREDYLFVAGGGTLVKVATDGTVTKWGIDAPGIDPIATVGGAGVLNGTYMYAVTFKNSVTGARSNPNPAAFTGPATVSPATQSVNLTSVPTSNDPQVDTREIWRTFANLTTLFKLAEIANNTATTYADNAPDADLQSEELPLDNAPPRGDFADAVGPYAGRMFWTRISASGEEGRIYYSPRGRPESLAGFIEVNNGDDPVVKLVSWGGSLYGWTNGHVIQVLGFTEPFTWREVFGAPGSDRPFSIVPTPFGIAYQSYDGIRMFAGTDSKLVGFEAIGRLLTGEALEDIPPFVADIAEYTGREVWFSDESTTLILDVASGAWRYTKQRISALYFEPDTKVLVAGSNEGVFIPEVPGVLTDNGAAIAFEVETPGVRFDVSVRGLVQRLYFDVDSGGQWLTPTLLVDGATYVLPQFATSVRPDPPIELAVGKWGHVWSVRLAGSLAASVTVFGVEADVYVPLPAEALK